jgi:hypothetical protein
VAPLLIWFIPLHLPTDMQGHIIIRTDIKEATQREEIVGSSSIGDLFDVK